MNRDAEVRLAVLGEIASLQNQLESMRARLEALTALIRQPDARGSKGKASSKKR